MANKSIKLKDKTIRETLKREYKTIKQYSYNRGNVTLAFSLNINDKKELETFRELMEIASKEITEDIKKCA